MSEILTTQWTICKERIQARLGTEDAAAWLPFLRLSFLSPGKVVLSGVPNSFFKTRISQQFRGVLRESIAETFSRISFHDDLRVELRVGPHDAAGEGDEATAPSEGEVPAASPTSATGAGTGPRLDARMTFATFAHSAGTHVALQAAQEVAAAPGRRYNPLILVAAPGLGKTHLLHAVVHAAAAANPECSAHYYTTETFAHDVWEAIRRRRMGDMRARYRALHLLALDDVDYLVGKAKAQEELLHTFDALHGTGRQLVLSTRTMPRAMAGLHPALRSRLEAGLLAELEPPDLQTRRRIVRAHAEAAGVNLQSDAELLLAERISSSPRQLEGAVVRIGAYASMLGTGITAAFVQQVAAPFFDCDPAEGLPVSQERIIGAVCDRFQLTANTLLSRSRRPAVVMARHVAAHLLREVGKLSYPEIGSALGGRSHSTMMHALASLAKTMALDAALRRQVRALRDSLWEENTQKSLHGFP